ncbi:hypothetical protein PIB30_098924 [Stylosanthes scabra]|uniref:Uncharacterized protein n=1 Tax=Stylosanthes scabra TaxID=79078 RepID=A0ABU6RWT2_9FABA|nr:hypothetical protein [Stylosanthes scabra]
MCSGERNTLGERETRTKMGRERSSSISATVLELHSTGIHGGSFVADEKRRHHHQNSPPLSCHRNSEPYSVAVQICHRNSYHRWCSSKPPPPSLG